MILPALTGHFTLQMIQLGNSENKKYLQHPVTTDRPLKLSEGFSLQEAKISHT